MDIFEIYEELKEDLYMLASPYTVEYVLKHSIIEDTLTKKLYEELKEFEKKHPELLV